MSYRNLGVIFKYSFLFLVQSCSSAFETQPCEKGYYRSGSVCIAESQGAVECKDPELNKIKKGTPLTLCNGEQAEGSLEVVEEIPSCTKDGEQNCVAKNNFKVVDITKVSASDIALNKVLAGVAGSRRAAKQCRNAANLNYFDSSPMALSKRLPLRIISAPGGNVVELGGNHGLVLNDPVQLVCSGGTGTSLTGGGVVVNTTYYAAIVTASRIQFQASPSGGAVTVTGTGGCTANWVVLSGKDGIAQELDNIDDLNGFAATTTSPSDGPWGADYVCNESNFTNVSGASPYMPSNTIPTNGSQSWSQIWRDELTGMLITNVLQDGVLSNQDWFQLNEMCKSLDSLNEGRGGTGWRLPTQKELMQLYVDGISKVPLAGASTDFRYWSSTSISYEFYRKRTVFPSDGELSYDALNQASLRAFCVR